MIDTYYCTDYGDVKVGGRQMLVLKLADNARQMCSTTWNFDIERRLINHLTAIAKSKWELMA